jgi:hypothetical protein
MHHDERKSLLIAEICVQSAVVAMIKEQYAARALPLPLDMAQGKAGAESVVGRGQRRRPRPCGL